MAAPEKTLFKEDQDMIEGIAAKAAMDAGISKNARAKLDKDSPAIKDAIKRRNLAQKQLDERKAKKGVNKNTVDYSVATRPKAKDKPAEKKTSEKALFGEGGAKTRNGKANVSKKQLSDFGGTLTQYMNQWNKSGKRPTKVSKDASGSGTKTDAPAKKTFRQRRAANLKAKIADENVGEGRKRRLKRRLGRVERRMAQGKAGGGMMKSKMSSKGGKMGGKMAPGYKKGGAAFPDLTGDGKVTQKDILKGRGVSGMKKGGMAKKGYSKGGAAMKSKGGTKRGKPRGVGAALRGYGKAMR
jgi:hypothetical protein|tara:strand:- start:1087 stop:1980 length:894 start_codon:yes stop_codon:yes gene_type:complete